MGGGGSRTGGSREPARLPERKSKSTLVAKKARIDELASYPAETIRCYAHQVFVSSSRGTCMTSERVWQTKNQGFFSAHFVRFFFLRKTSRFETGFFVSFAIG